MFAIDLCRGKGVLGMPKPQSQAEWQEQMAHRILEVVRSELYLELRFLNPVLSALPWQSAENGTALYTDGFTLRFLPLHIIELWQRNRKALSRAYLHTVFHCLFRHLWLRGARNKELWGLACDIAVEYTIDHLGADSLKRPLSYTRTQLYAQLEAAGPAAAGVIYRYLALHCDAEMLQKLWREFFVDEHGLWPKESQMSPPMLSAGQDWEKRGRQVESEQQRQHQEAGQSGQTLSAQIKAGQSRRSYRDFLRRFAVLREEAHLDPDSFDPGFYAYGLQVYGNMPLLEPLETRESSKIHDLVLVLDTSQSTSGELVKGFLRETFTLLRSTGSFFERCRLRILQCDDAVRQDIALKSPAELDGYLQSFTLLGGGGTDFRPAFDHVDALVAAGQMALPSGLLYFTDGKGVYPTRVPKYETAFLFLGDAPETPPWAIRLVLDSEEFAPAPPPAEPFWQDDWQPDEHIM